MQQQIDRDYSRIKADVLQIIEDEMERIANDPYLKHLIPQEDGKKRNRTPLFYFKPASSSRALWIVQGRPFGFRGKIILAALRYFSRKPCLSGSVYRKALVVQRAAKARIFTIKIIKS
mgnify:CR=1 FL=1